MIKRELKVGEKVRVRKFNGLSVEELKSIGIQGGMLKYLGRKVEIAGKNIYTHGIVYTVKGIEKYLWVSAWFKELKKKTKTVKQLVLMQKMTCIFESSNSKITLLGETVDGRSIRDNEILKVMLGGEIAESKDYFYKLYGGEKI